MRFRDALKWSLKYHSIAVFPTLLGLGIIVATIYLGAVQPVLPVLQSASLSLDALAAVVTAINGPLVLVGIVLGIFTRRVGRTALLVRTQSQAIDAALAAHESTGSTDSASGAGAKPAIETDVDSDTSIQADGEVGNEVDTSGEVDTDDEVDSDRESEDVVSAYDDSFSSGSGGSKATETATKSSEKADKADEGGGYDEFGYGSDDTGAGGK